MPSDIFLDDKNSNTAITASESSTGSTSKGFTFWIIIFTLTLSIFMSALEITVVSTSLPVIVGTLHGSNFSWVGMAYPLAASAFLPMSGGLAEIFGRRYTMLGALIMFMLGSALCGSAKTMNWLIGARAVQGIGGGGIVSLSTIIMADLTPLSERALYNSFIVAAWAVASTIGSLVGGAFASGGLWRWIFYMNLPICGVCVGLVLTCLHLPTPTGTLHEKVLKIDWIGNLLIIASTTSVTLGLTWGGVTFAWSSHQVLLCLILGFLGFATFVLYEAKFAQFPILPIDIISNRSSLSGYLQTFITGVGMLGTAYYLPVFYQACYNASALRSGVLSLGMSVSLCIFMIFSGASIAKLKKYRLNMWTGWALQAIGFGVLSSMNPSSHVAEVVGLPVISAAGAGLVVAAGYFPILAPLPVEKNAYALAFYAFLRSFANIWGICIGASILQNGLEGKISPQILAELQLHGNEVNLLYSIIPQIRLLQSPAKEELGNAFSRSVRIVWIVYAGLACGGFLASLLMPDLPIQNQTDEKWQIQNKNVKKQYEEATGLNIA